MRKILPFIAMLFFCTLQDAIASNHQKYVQSFLQQYQPDRGITVLEIGVDNCKYAYKVSKNFNATAVMLYLGRLHDESQFTMENQYPNLVIVNPVTMNVNQLETLVRCEHFDVVIIHGIPNKLKRGHALTDNFDQTFDLLLQLGDHTFIEVDSQDNKTAQLCSKKNMMKLRASKDALWYANTEKLGLDIARWNCNHMNWQKQVYRYPIFSNFEKKHYQKKESADTEIPWLKGINLSTFVMLRGICPCEKTIQNCLEAMRSIKHNDLIIGNMIVQGRSIIPIDLDDPRWNGNVTKCITAALTVFNENSNRLKNPDQSLRFYREYLTRMNKKYS